MLSPDESEPNKGRVSLRLIELGELTSAGVEIKSGLETDMRVVTAGVTFLRDQQLVKL
ncbi:MAG: hypothetical protein AAF197_12375 [Pseudomonadota bacterium]